MKVLLVEDNPGDSRLIQEMLAENQPGQFELSHDIYLKDALNRLDEQSFDVILLDLGLPDSHGLDTFTKISSRVPDAPVIVMSGYDDESFAVKAVRQGAQDYLVKGCFDSSLLIRAIHYAAERKSLVRELAESQFKEMQTKNQFLSYISHELRSPLTALYQFTTILLDGLAGDITPEQREYLEISLNKIKDLQSMVGDLREATRAQTGRLAFDFTKVSLPDVIEETIKIFHIRAGEKGVNLSSKIQEDIPAVYADRERIIQIVSNLIDNAIKFTPDGGSIHIKACVDSQIPELVCVSVADSGCGIAGDEKDRIFEYQYQIKSTHKTKASGLGLGLYICKELVAGHGGKIWVESQPGRGSTFTFTLPVYSLEKQLETILTDEKLKTSSIALITVEFHHSDGRTISNMDEAHIRKLIDLVEPGIKSDSGFLLQLDDTRSAADNLKSVSKSYLLASADSDGDNVITAHISDALDNYKEMQSTKLKYNISSLRLADMTTVQESKSVEEMVKELVTCIQKSAEK